MTPSRFLIALTLLGVLLFPVEISAEGTGTGSELTDTGALLETQRLEEEKWQAYRERTAGFFASMMNNRKAERAFREQQAIRRQKLFEKRMLCREDIRKANRDALKRVTLACFRATLTLELEMLRKEKQYIEEVAGPTGEFRARAVASIERLSDAVSTIITAIDAGVYGSKADVQEAKINLEKSYRVHRRHALALLATDRSIIWVTHLMVRLDDIRTTADLQEEIRLKLDDAIACMEVRKTTLEALLAEESYQALIDGFRQAESELKICSNLANDAHGLNTKFEQEKAAQNAE